MFYKFPNINNEFISADSTQVTFSPFNSKCMPFHMILLLHYYIGKPSAPLNTSVTANGPNIVIISWYPPLHSSQCIDYYIVGIVNGNHDYIYIIRTLPTVLQHLLLTRNELFI